MSSIVKIEEFTDREISKIFKGWDELYASTGQAFDLGRWMTFYTLDSVFALTFGEDFGFLDKREDQFSMMESLEKLSTYGAVVRFTPVLPFDICRSSSLTGLGWPDAYPPQDHWKKRIFSRPSFGASFLRVDPKHDQARWYSSDYFQKEARGRNPRSRLCHYVCRAPVDDTKAQS